MLILSRWNLCVFRLSLLHHLHGRHLSCSRIWRVLSLCGWLLLCLGSGDVLGVCWWDLLVCGLGVLHHLVGRLLRGPRCGRSDCLLGRNLLGCRSGLLLVLSCRNVLRICCRGLHHLYCWHIRCCWFWRVHSLRCGSVLCRRIRLVLVLRGG